MPVYAYRWADGSISVCSARNKDEASWLLDEVGPVSRKLIVRLKGQVLLTTKFDVDKGWLFSDDMPFEGSTHWELLRRCYPHYNFVRRKCETDDNGNYSKKDMARLRKSLIKDTMEASERIEKTPDVTLEFKLHPKELPGQNN